MRPLLRERALGDTAAGSVDAEVKRTEVVGRPRDRGFGAGEVGDVAGVETGAMAESGRDLLPLRARAVEDRDARSLPHQHLGRRPGHTRSATHHHCRLSADLHPRLLAEATTANELTVMAMVAVSASATSAESSELQPCRRHGSLGRVGRRSDTECYSTICAHLLYAGERQCAMQSVRPKARRFACPTFDVNRAAQTPGIRRSLRNARPAERGPRPPSPAGRRGMLATIANGGVRAPRSGALRTERAGTPALQSSAKRVSGGARASVPAAARRAAGNARDDRERSSESTALRRAGARRAGRDARAPPEAGLLRVREASVRRSAGLRARRRPEGGGGCSRRSRTVE